MFYLVSKAADYLCEGEKHLDLTQVLKSEPPYGL